MKWRLKRGNIIKEKTPGISLNSKLVLVEYQGYENGLFQRTVKMVYCKDQKLSFVVTTWCKYYLPYLVTTQTIT